MYEYRKLTPTQRKRLIEERKALGQPPHSPPHPVQDQLFYLLTAVCYEHQLHMQTVDRRRQLLDAVSKNFNKQGMKLLAWVILPNHYHLLADVTEFEKLGSIFRLVHGPTSRQWNLKDGQSGRKVWYRFSDRAIRSERHYFTTLNYIHFNPVKHGYVESPYDWAESSVHWYLEHHGREWLRSLWTTYPLRDYGKGWDDL